ncbi:MAG: ATP-binding protein, partial [Opitutaceae bacterium]
ALRKLQWASPEKLSRERNHAEIDALERFMHSHQLGAMVISGGKTLRVVLATGVPSSRRPCTYPQVKQLIEFASIIEVSMQRAQFSAMARRSEQLATVGMLGASLAHEIRNPLVTLKTFAQLFPHRHSEPAFRAKFASLLISEVGRIEHLTEQLLDMASPHHYVPQKLSLNEVAETCFDLVSPKANSHSVQLKSDLTAHPDFVLTDPHAARQVLLNLCINAIQAMESKTAERWLLLSTRRVDNGIELAVTDNGPGIRPEISARLFQPFVTSKSSGFGLGLAICGDILGGLGASISADPYVEGRGATFRVVFPEAKN